jgi:cysteine desulfurase
VIFTSGATEAAAVLAHLPDGHDVLVEPSAHDCLWAQMRMGRDEARQSLTLGWGYANNETGLIAEPPEKANGKRAWSGRMADWLMLDIVQAVGRVPFSFAWSGADMALVSAHKFGGPKGIGALILREGLEISPVLTGGGQEMGRRAGTENVTGIAGMGAAAEAAAHDLASGVWDKVAQFRNILESALSDPEMGTISVGKDLNRLPNTLCLVTPGWKGETQVMQMDLAGFAISAGSACSSGKVRPSRVLRSMGFDDEAAGSAIRVSLGPAVAEAEVMRFADTWAALRRKRPARQANSGVCAPAMGDRG